MTTPRLLLGLLVVVPALLWVAGMTVPALIATGLSGAAYWWSLRRHPWRPCRRCAGSGQHRDTRVWVGAHGRCTRCNDKRHFPRLGVRVLTPGRARALTMGDRGRYG